MKKKHLQNGTREIKLEHDEVFILNDCGCCECHFSKKYTFLPIRKDCFSKGRLEKGTIYDIFLREMECDTKSSKEFEVVR
jgi:hypothetical protein